MHKTDPRTKGQPRHNLRPNQARSYSHRLGHIMDDPASAASYNAQFLQQDEDKDGPTTLQEAI